MAESKYIVRCKTNGEFVVEYTRNAQFETSKTKADAQEFNEVKANEFVATHGAQFETVELK